MFLNFIKVAIRNLIRQRGYAAINILGLAIGMACSIIITLFIIHETSFDRFHEKTDQIVRIYLDGKLQETELKASETCPPAGPTFQAEIPEVLNYTRINKSSNVIFRKGDRTYSESDFCWADSGFFEIFSFDLLLGDPSEALTKPRSMVLSEKMARKYFGDENPVGQTLEVFDDSVDYTVTGVMADIPSNSHLFFDFLVDFQSNSRANDVHWTSNNFDTYLLLDEKADYHDVEDKMAPILNGHLESELKQMAGVSLDEWMESGNYYYMKLQPLKEIHLETEILHDMRPSFDVKYIYIFALIALFIIVIACINFMNLSTARSAGRAREVGLRKVVGSEKRSLIWQFLAESFTMVIFALIIALLLVEVSLPWINNKIQMSLSTTYFDSWYLVPGILALVVVIGLLAGSYPAFYLASFKPVSVLSGKLEKGSRSSSLRSVLVVLQFAISIFIILSTIVVSRQIKYMVNKDLGFEKEQLLVLQRFQVVGRTKVETFKQEIAKIPGVLSSTSSTSVPGRSNNYNGHWIKGRPTDEVNLMEVNYADHDFTKTYGLEVVNGRFLDPSLSTDSLAILINEEAVNRFNLEEPLKTIFMRPKNEQGEFLEQQVVGVMKDFHLTSLHDRIRPYTINIRDPNWGWIPYLTIRLEPRDIANSIRQIENTWNEFTSNYPFQYFFLDDDFASRYDQEMRTRRIFMAFSLLAILVACLGLLGLTAFITEQRTREIGIRKAMGASAALIVRLISKETVILIGVATIISWPVAYFFMKNWLQDFAYRIDLTFLPFLLSFLFAMLLALVTISVQAIIAALRNPADALRYE